MTKNGFESKRLTSNFPRKMSSHDLAKFWPSVRAYFAPSSECARWQRRCKSTDSHLRCHRAHSDDGAKYALTDGQNLAKSWLDIFLGKLEVSRLLSNPFLVISDPGPHSERSSIPYH